jgi:hypothetical protein
MEDEMIPEIDLIEDEDDGECECGECDECLSGDDCSCGECEDCVEKAESLEDSFDDDNIDDLLF